MGWGTAGSLFDMSVEKSNEFSSSLYSLSPPLAHLPDSQLLMSVSVNATSDVRR